MGETTLVFSVCTANERLKANLLESYPFPLWRYRVLQGLEIGFAGSKFTFSVNLFPNSLGQVFF